MRTAASVGEVMRTPHQIVVVSVDAPVRRVVDLMVKAGVEGVLVVDSRGRVIGSIGDEQLVRRASERPQRPWRRHLVDRDTVPGEGILDLGTGEVMLTHVVQVSPDASLASALGLFDEYAVNVLPVLDGGVWLARFSGVTSSRSSSIVSRGPRRTRRPTSGGNTS